MDILYSMFIPTRFILCNKLTEILIVSHGLFSIYGNQISQLGQINLKEFYFDTHFQLNFRT